MLPFRKKTLPDQQPQSGVAEPHCCQIRTWVASASHYIEGNYPVFARVTLRHLYANVVKQFEIICGDGWYGSPLFCLLNEASEGLQSLKLLIGHRKPPPDGCAVPSSVAAQR